MKSTIWQTIARGLSLAGITSLLLAAGATTAHAQWTWWGSTWQSLYEYSPGNDDVGRDIVVLSDNTHVAAGETAATPTTRDIYVVKTDVCYNTIWGYSYNFGENEQVARIRQTADDGFIIVGTTQLLNSRSCRLPNSIFLLKIDALGNVQWGKVYGGEDLDAGYDVQVLSDGYIVAGETSSFGSGGKDGYLIRTDLSGNVIWNRVYGDAGDQSFKSCTVAANGDIIAAGETSALGNAPDILLVRVDQPAGNLVPGFPMHYSSGPGDVYPDIAYGVVEDAGGDIIMAGATQMNGFSMDGFLMRTTSTGVATNFATYGGTSHTGLDEFRDLVKVPVGHYAVTGRVQNIPGGLGNFDMYVGIFDGTFVPVSSVVHGGLNDDAGWGIAVGARIAVAGGSNSFALTPENMFLVRQDITGYTGCEVTSVEMETLTDYIWSDRLPLVTFSVGSSCTVTPTRGERMTTEYPICDNCVIYPHKDLRPGETIIPFPNGRGTAAPESGAMSDLKIYPNPVTRNRTLVLEHRPVPGTTIALTISDMAGKIISTINRPADGHAEIDTKGWPAGSYIIQATMGDETTSRRITVMEN